MAIGSLQNEDASKHLTDWGLELSPQAMPIEARVLEPETIYFGKNYSEQVNAKADWGRAATTK